MSKLRQNTFEHYLDRWNGRKTWSASCWSCRLSESSETGSSWPNTCLASFRPDNNDARDAAILLARSIIVRRVSRWDAACSRTSSASCSVLSTWLVTSVNIHTELHLQHQAAPRAVTLSWHTHRASLATPSSPWPWHSADIILASTAWLCHFQCLMNTPNTNQVIFHNTVCNKFSQFCFSTCQKWLTDCSQYMFLIFYMLPHLLYINTDHMSPSWPEQWWHTRRIQLLNR